MTTMEAEIPRQLRKAASIIEERGHQRCAFGSKNGPVCLASALAEANGTQSNPFGDLYFTQEITPAGLKMLDDLPKVERPYGPPGKTYDICHFNNRHTSEEVVGQLRKTADKLEAAAV